MISKKVGLEINLRKTKIMTMKKTMVKFDIWDGNPYSEVS